MLNKAHQRLELLLSVTESVSAAENYIQALQFTLEQVCKVSGWSIGEAWEPSNDKARLIYSEAWYASDPKLNPFKKIGQQYTFRRGEGLPGKAWETHAPIWMPDVSKDPDFHRAKEAVNYNLKAGVAIPVMVGQEVVNIMVFLLTRRSEEDPEFIQIISGVAQQLGQLFIRKKTEERINQLAIEYEAVFDGSQSAMFLVEAKHDNTFVYVRGNKAYEKNSGYTNGQIKGKTPHDLFGQEQGEKILAFYRQCIESGKPFFYETTLHHRNEDVVLMAELTPIFEGKKIKYLVGSSTDITDKKKMMNELLEAKEQAEASDRLKTAFLNNISHEIRTPLNGILGFGQLLTQDQLSRGNKAQYMKGMHLSSQRLIETIDKIVDMSMVLSGTLEAHDETVNPRSLLHDLYEQYAYKCKTRDLQLALEMDEGLEKVQLQSDGQLLRKALVHLLDNAIKFTHEGQITIKGIIGEDHLLTFAVEDNGEGIHAQYMEKLFEPFSQEDVQTTRGHEGSGLGLAIAKGIVDKLGGKLHVESEKGKGSRFYISLQATPLQTAEEELEANKQDGQSDPTAQPAILVADDDEMGRFLLDTLLQDHFKKIHFVSNGKEALDTFLKHPDIGLVLMDVKMPVMDGLEATRQIRASGRQVAVIAITAHAMTGDEARIKAAGCDDYIAKPLSSKILFEKIRQFI